MYLFRHIMRAELDGSLSLSLLEATLELGLDVFSRAGATTDAVELEGVVVELSSASWAFLPFWPFFFLVMVYNWDGMC